MSKKIVVIGAGIAGLSAGVYGRLNGFDVEIYESHQLPGGLCTAWKRKGYLFDGCIHWLTGSGPKDSFHKLWTELGAIEGKKFFDPDVFISIEGADGRTVRLYTDVNRLEAHLLEISPADRVSIVHLCSLIRKFSKFSMPMDKAFELSGFMDTIKTLTRLAPFLKDLNMLTTMKLSDFATRFRDPLIREAFSTMFGSGDYALTTLVMTMALLNNRAGGYPEGGSLEFSRSIEARFLHLGGKVCYGKRVEKVLVDQNNCACGIRLTDGSEVRGDYVISAADLRTTVYEMLDGRFIEPQHQELINNVPVAPSSVMVFFGLRQKFQKDADCYSYHFRTEQPILVGQTAHNIMTERNFNFDDSIATDGKSVICSLFIDSCFDYWTELRKDRAAYDTEKKRIAASVAEIFEQRYPGFTESIEAIDVVTPATYHRYTGTWKGTYMTWILSGKNASRFRLVKKTLPGLGNFFLSGMWVMPPGGVPTGAKTSRDIIEIICKQEKRPFNVTPK